VVLGRIDGVYADNVCVDLLEVGNVSSAGVAVSEWIRIFGIGACRAIGRVVLLVCDALEIAAMLLI
jgi:hypothetical protein